MKHTGTYILRWNLILDIFVSWHLYDQFDQTLHWYVQERINIHYPTPVVAEVKEEVSEDILDEMMEERMVQVVVVTIEEPAINL